MATDRDNDLFDPRNPHSPYNKFNYDSPYSYANPLSPNYDPSKQLTVVEAATGLAMMGFVWLVIFFIGFTLYAPWKAFLFFATMAILYLEAKVFLTDSGSKFINFVKAGLFITVNVTLVVWLILEFYPTYM